MQTSMKMCQFVSLLPCYGHDFTYMDWEFTGFRDAYFEIIGGNGTFAVNLEFISR